MALKHYGGRVPEVASTWTCPSCNAENTVPLKAGCQTCGAGGDARKVQTPAAAPLDSAGTRPAEVLAFEAWVSERSSSETNWMLVREAFMAGVAWAQGEATAARIEGRTPPPLVIAGHNVAMLDGDGPPPSPLTLWTDDGKHQDRVEPHVLATVLAALAFYRDNVLNYGEVANQLTPDAVTELLARLTPQETV